MVQRSSPLNCFSPSPDLTPQEWVTEHQHCIQDRTFTFDLQIVSTSSYLSQNVVQNMLHTYTHTHLFLHINYFSIQKLVLMEHLVQSIANLCNDVLGIQLHL